MTRDPPARRDLIAVTMDPENRRVVMTASAWQHIKTAHEDMTRRLRDVMAAVREPDRRMEGRGAGEEWFFAEHVGSSRWLQVVVHFEGGEGWIATAFARSLLPRR